MRKLKAYVNNYTLAALAVSVLCSVICLLLNFSTAFSAAFNSTVGRAVRFLLAELTVLFPFSLAEQIVFLYPLIIAVLCVAAVKAVKKGAKCTVRLISSLVATAMLIWCVFTCTVTPGYNTESFSARSGLKDREVSAEELYETCLIVVGELEGLCDDALYTVDGDSLMPFSYGELSNELCLSYNGICEEYSYIDSFCTKVKPLVISKYMTYTHISGIYTFFTGEANINTNYPDYVCVYSAAHEMAHQRGISREDEANFVAFLVCINSQNSYVRYSGYLNMYEYLSNALYKASPQLYSDAYSALPASAKSELRAYSLFFKKYSNNPIAEVSDKINNTYLELQGTEGTASYGMVVDLAVSYYLD